MISSSDIAEKLLQINAIKLNPHNPFTWASGMRSPIYCDNRLSLSFPDARNLVVEAFVENAAAYEGIDAIAGVATAGIPHGTLLADRLGIPFIYVRSSAKAHGRKNQIEGFVQGGEKVLVIEDLISTGGSVLKAVDALKEAGCEIAAVLAIFTYNLPVAENNFKSADVEYVTLSNYDVLLEKAVEKKYIDSEALASLKEWKKNPSQWSKNFI